jgi:hypothetical protein
MAALAAILVASLAASLAGAAEAPGLGDADGFAVLAGSGVTNAGLTVVDGNLGACPTSTVTGFPPGVVNGTIADTAACGSAQSALTTAYDEVAARTPTTAYGVPTDLGGLTLTTGVYNSPTSLGVTGTLALDAQGDPNALFVFQAGSTVITATGSEVSLLNGAQACNVFWQVGSSATIGVDSTLVGTMLVHTSITANGGAMVQGRLLARGGAVTLDSNTVTAPTCAPATGGSLSLAQTPTAGTALIEGTAVALPVTSVTDTRDGTVRNWTVTATVSDLVSGVNAIPAADTTLDQSGSFTTGTGTVGTGGLVSATDNSIDSVYTYTPTAELAHQGNIPAGAYVGTVTQTVV